MTDDRLLRRYQLTVCSEARLCYHSGWWIKRDPASKWKSLKGKGKELSLSLGDVTCRGSWSRASNPKPAGRSYTLYLA